jgi:hypothetical protein
MNDKCKHCKHTRADHMICAAWPCMGWGDAELGGIGFCDCEGFKAE